MDFPFLCQFTYVLQPSCLGIEVERTIVILWVNRSMYGSFIGYIIITPWFASWWQSVLSTHEMHGRAMQDATYRHMKTCIAPQILLTLTDQVRTHEDHHS